jgi:gliding motility-associated-like protein
MLRKKGIYLSIWELPSRNFGKHRLILFLPSVWLFIYVINEEKTFYFMMTKIHFFGELFFLDIELIMIFDRFGKLLLRYDEYFTPWNGDYLGQKMPSGDYWYIIYLKREAKKYVGHFTLIR